MNSVFSSLFNSVFELILTGESLFGCICELYRRLLLTTLNLLFRSSLRADFKGDLTVGEIILWFSIIRFCFRWLIMN